MIFTRGCTILHKSSHWILRKPHERGVYYHSLKVRKRKQNKTLFGTDQLGYREAEIWSQQYDAKPRPLPCSVSQDTSPAEVARRTFSTWGWRLIWRKALSPSQVPLWSPPPAPAATQRGWAGRGWRWDLTRGTSDVWRLTVLASLWAFLHPD